MLDEWLGFQQQHLLVAYRNNGKGCEKLTEKEVEEAWEAGKRLPVSTFVFHLDQCEVPKQDTPLCLSKLILSVRRKYWEKRSTPT